jgi:hypothetical protein
MRLRRSMMRLILRRPWLFPQMVGLAWAARARGWYRRPPFLPLPPDSYLDWRMETAYGDREADPPADDMARFLRWAARMRRSR